MTKVLLLLAAAGVAGAVILANREEKKSLPPARTTPRTPVQIGTVREVDGILAVWNGRYWDPITQSSRGPGRWFQPVNTGR